MLTSRQFEQNTKYIVNKSIETVGCSCITSIRQKHKQRQTNQSLKDKVKKLLLGSVLSDTSKKKKILPLQLSQGFEFYPSEK